MPFQSNSGKFKLVNKKIDFIKNYCLNLFHKEENCSLSNFNSEGKKITHKSLGELQIKEDKHSDRFECFCFCERTNINLIGNSKNFLIQNINQKFFY